MQKYVLELLTGTVLKTTPVETSSLHLLSIYIHWTPARCPYCNRHKKIRLWKERSCLQKRWTRNRGNQIKKQFKCYKEHTWLQVMERRPEPPRRTNRSQPGLKRKERHFGRKSRGKERVMVWKWDITVHVRKTPSSLAWNTHAVRGGQMGWWQAASRNPTEMVKDQIRSPCGAPDLDFILEAMRTRT